MGNIVTMIQKNATTDPTAIPALAPGLNPVLVSGFPFDGVFWMAVVPGPVVTAKDVGRALVIAISLWIKDFEIFT